MAKLVDLLAKYLVEWPDGAVNAMQSSIDNTVLFYFEDKRCDDYDFVAPDQAEDHLLGEVTKSQYLAARDHLHADTMKEMIKVGGTLEVQEFDTDQALWDKVAVAAVNGEMSCQSNAEKRLDAGDLVRYSFAVADAFMAERAKRLKGGA